jgi:hypothetical protein
MARRWRWGSSLMQGLGGPVADPQETVAYLGLSMADLIADVGPEEAELAYRQFGRQAFLPVRTLDRILRQVAPDLVVCTNSPRAERAAVLAAGNSAFRRSAWWTCSPSTK